MLEDVLDDFSTVEHAREAYGAVVDLDTETVDVPATEALRSQMRADPRRGDSRSAVSPAGSSTVEDLVAWLNKRLGDDWSFHVQRHQRNGVGIEVTA